MAKCQVLASVVVICNWNGSKVAPFDLLLLVLGCFVSGEALSSANFTSCLSLKDSGHSCAEGASSLVATCLRREA